MIMRVSSILVALVLAVFFTGCSELPQTDIDSGKAALEQARLAEAELYAPDLFREATDSINAASIEIQNQESKFSLFRSYDKSKEMFATAQKLAEKANTAAAAEKERVRLADSTLIAEIGFLIEETSKIIANAPRGKGSRVDIKVMQADLDAAASALATPTAEYQNGQYLVAKEKLLAIKTQVTAVKSNIEEAIAKLKK